MKKLSKYLLYGCNLVLMGLIIYNIFSYKLEDKEVMINLVDYDDRRFVSYLLKDEVPDPTLLSMEPSLPLSQNSNDLEIIKEDKINEPLYESTLPKENSTNSDNSALKNKEEVKEDIKEEIKEEVKEQSKKELDNNQAIETLIGKIAGYGSDCYGCNMYTASGKYIGEGNIYYDDATYGKVRIVAGDYLYPFGTIVRISNIDFFHDEPFYAIVLDRGGNIGKNKIYLFDLLFATEKEALQMGTEVNIKFEIMRLGY